MNNLTGGHTFQLSPDSCQTEIDGVAWEKYQRKQLPSVLSAQDPFFFKQSSFQGKLGYTWDEDSNIGQFDEMDEQEEFENTDTRIGNTKNVKVQKWGKQVPVSDEAFNADMHGLRASIGTKIGDRARLTQDKRAILNTYGDAFAGSVNTTPDAVSLANNSHVTLKSITIDNLETGVLNADNLWTAVQALHNQKAQDGENGGYQFEGLLVPLILYKTAHEIMEATLVPYSAENQPNIFDTVYGTVNVKQSQYLGSTYNSASNANTSYHLLSSSHLINRMVYRDLYTSLIPPENTANDSYVYRGRFLERHFPESWCGYIGSNGTV